MLYGGAVLSCGGSMVSPRPLAAAGPPVSQGRSPHPGQTTDTSECEVSLGPLLPAEADRDWQCSS